MDGRMRTQMTSRMSTQTTRRLSGAVTLMLFGACLFGAPSGARAQTAEQIIAANIAASGGEEAIARIKNFGNTGRISVESPLFGKLEGTLEAVRVPGRGYYEHVVLGPIQQNKGWDGTRGWEQSPTGLRTLNGVELAALATQSFVNPFVALRTLAPAGLRIERLQDAEVLGRPHYVLAVKTADSPTLTMYIDRQTNLLTRNSVMVAVPKLGEAPAVTDVGDYEVVAGVSMPTTMTVTMEGISTMRLTLKSTVVNTAVDATIFAAPGGGATSAPKAAAGETR
jgi:hypothetical protein